MRTGTITNSKCQRRVGTVADLLVECLEKEGVRFVFGVPGEETDALLSALAESSITFVPCRHEQGSALIADVWGRLTGEAGVCLSTQGPEAINQLTVVADANLDKAPLVAITAQGGLDRLHHESHRRLDIVRMFGLVTKWNSAIYSAEMVPEVVRKAFKISEMEKPGSTHIELAQDVAGQLVSDRWKPMEPRPIPQPKADASAIETVLAFVARFASSPGDCRQWRNSFASVTSRQLCGYSTTV